MWPGASLANQRRKRTQAHASPPHQVRHSTFVGLLRIKASFINMACLPHAYPCPTRHRLTKGKAAKTSALKPKFNAHSGVDDWEQCSSSSVCQVRPEDTLESACQWDSLLDESELLCQGHYNLPALPNEPTLLHQFWASVATVSSW